MPGMSSPYAPRTFRKGNRTEVVNSFQEETNLRWDGWAADDEGGPYTPPPTFNEAEVEELKTALGTQFASLEEVPPAVQQYVTSTVVDNEVIQDLADETGYVHAWVDQAGRRAMAIRKDGTVDIPKVGLGAGAVPRAALSSDIHLPQTVSSEDYTATWVDQADKLAMWLRRSGAVGFARLDAPTLAYIGQALVLAGLIAPTTYTTPEGTVRGITSGPDIVCWGDSLTTSSGGSTPAGIYPALAGGWVAALATLTGRTVRGAGVGGEDSVTIAARAGATPLLMLPAGGEIPASGGVAVTLLPIGGVTPAPLKQGSGTPGSTFSGQLAGVQGTLSLSGEVYTFTRTAAGTAVPVTRPVAFRTDFSAARRGDIAVLWLGQNGPTDARAIADDRAIIEHLSALHKRWLVISRPTTTDVQDQTYHDAFGRRFIAIRKYMVEYGLADAGIAPTPQDTTDMAAGTIPTSLRIDGVHGNAAYYNIVAQQVNARLREFGWI